jgi:hypothetical protein
MSVTPDDAIVAGELCRTTLEPVVDHDWSIRAGALDWSCARTVEHMTNANLRYALHLGARAVGPLPRVRPHDEQLTQQDLLTLVVAASATLAETARAAPPHARGFHPAGMADAEGFLAMGCDEILVHTFDVASALGVSFQPPADLCARVVARLFPWAPGDTDPWPTLLWANGRAPIGERARLDGDWSWQCAPVSEWDGTPKLRVKPGSW